MSRDDPDVPSASKVRNLLEKNLQPAKLVEQDRASKWVLTTAGKKEAKRVAGIMQGVAHDDEGDDGEPF